MQRVRSDSHRAPAHAPGVFRSTVPFPGQTEFRLVDSQGEPMAFMTFRASLVDDDLLQWLARWSLAHDVDTALKLTP